MRIIRISQAGNLIEVVPETLDDLWHLERVLEAGDVVSGKTERKIKPLNEGEKARKVTMSLDVEVEKVEFHEFASMLRVSGIIVGGRPEELVELKAHHTIDVAPGTFVKVVKKKLKKWQVDRLEKAKNTSVRENALAVVLDDEVADFATVKEFGLEQRAKIAAERVGKMYSAEDSEKKYFDGIIEKVKSTGAKKVIFAGPGFTKNNLKKYIEDRGLGRTFQAFFESTNSVGVSGLNELVKSGILEKAVSKLQLSEETKVVEELLAEIGKGSGLVAYGYDEVKNAVEAGAVEKLVVSDKTLLGEREKTEALMEQAEGQRGTVHIISDRHDAGKKLVGIGGIAAKLRYAVHRE